MMLKIPSEKYYGYKGKTKRLFVKKYQSLHLKWMEKVEFEDGIVDGWFDSSMKEYLLKLPEKEGMKRFTGNSIKMIEFLKLYGAVEYEENEKGVHIDYDDKMGFVTQKDRYGHFVGGDLIYGYRFRELLKDVHDNWGCIWSGECNLIVRKRVRIVRR